MGTIKGQNGMVLTEAKDIKKRWQEYTEELYTKDLHDPDNHDGVHSPADGAAKAIEFLVADSSLYGYSILTCLVHESSISSSKLSGVSGFLHGFSSFLLILNLYRRRIWASSLNSHLQYDPKSQTSWNVKSSGS